MMEQETTIRENMRLYLLGLVSEEDQKRVEQGILTDSSAYDESLIVEEELIDDYLADELSDAERQAFDSHFLNAPEHQEQLQFARAFRTYVDSEDVQIVEKPPVLQPARESRGFSSWFLIPNVRFGVITAAILLVLGVVSWIALRNSQRGNYPVVAVTLNPAGVTRDRGTVQDVLIPNEDALVEFHLPASVGPTETYEAVLLSSTGAVVLQKSDLRERVFNEVVVPVPGDLLSAGEYQIRLNGTDQNGTRESIASYRFRVVR